jgi:DNA-binding transcriptional LysR family regulator
VVGQLIVAPGTGMGRPGIRLVSVWPSCVFAALRTIGPHAIFHCVVRKGALVIDSFNTFLVVTVAGNFSKAAQSLGVAASSVMRKIDLLEAELGAKVFVRTSRRVYLTDAGEQLLPRARAILAELAEVKDAISSLHAEPRGVLTVTAPSPFGRRHVGPAVTSFLRRYPQVEVELHLSDEIVDLAALRYDVAVRIGVLPDSGLLATRLAPQRRLVCASPDYLARCGIPRSPPDLLKHNCLTVRSLPARVGWWTFSGVNGGKPLAVRGSLRCDESDALLRAALDGVGIVHLATWMVAEDVGAGRLVPLFGQELSHAPSTASGIHALRVPGRSPVKSKLFLEHLRTVFGVADGGSPYWDRAAPAAARRRRT